MHQDMQSWGGPAKTPAPKRGRGGWDRRKVTTCAGNQEVTQHSAAGNRRAKRARRRRRDRARFCWGSLPWRCRRLRRAMRAIVGRQVNGACRKGEWKAGSVSSLSPSSPRFLPRCGSARLHTPALSPTRAKERDIPQTAATSKQSYQSLAILPSMRWQLNAVSRTAIPFSPVMRSIDFLQYVQGMDLLPTSHAIEAATNSPQRIHR
jgi:hypothetical protein